MEPCCLPVHDNITKCVIIQVVTFHPRFKFEPLIDVSQQPSPLCCGKKTVLKVLDASERYLADSVLSKDREQSFFIVVRVR